MMRLLTALACLITTVGAATAAGLLPDWLIYLVIPAPVLLVVALQGVLRHDLDTSVDRIGRIADAAPADDSRSTLLGPIDDALDRLGRTFADRLRAAARREQTEAMIVDRLPDPLIVLDVNQAVLRCNQAATRSFGQDIAAVLRHPRLHTAIDRAMAGESGQEVELSLSAPVQRDVQATLIRLDPAVSPDGRVAIVLSDRSRDKAVERMRADFVANVSHELRTPLTSLIGFTDTLRGPASDDPPARDRFLAIMAEQGMRMRRLIDDLLSLSRIELVEHQPPTETVDVADLIAHVLTFYTPHLNGRRVSIVSAVDPGTPLVRGDGDQLIQVLQNLVDNALKYGRDGGTIRMSARRSGTGAEWPRAGVILAVADDGVGIPAEHLPRLTERFYRVDRARSRSAGGTGLGLAIVKHIVNRHRGQLRIESTEGVGTTISVWLPLASTEAMAVAA
jgi:two-component system phosphate regulon sensor histidine kinase PhoR